MAKQVKDYDPAHPTSTGSPDDTGTRNPRPAVDEKGQTHENAPGDKGRAHLSHPSVAAIIPATPGGPAGPDEPMVVVSPKEPGKDAKVTPIDKTDKRVLKEHSSD